jgi:peptide/nickel transport system substrate-binding protein
MFASKKWANLFALLIVASLILSACATPTPEVIEKIVTQVVKETVKETVIVEGTPQIVEKEVTKVVKETVKETVVVQVTPTPEPAKPAEPKTYRMGIFEDMTTTNYWAYMDPDSSVWNGYVLDSVDPPQFWDLAYPDILFIPYMATDLPQPLVQEGDFWVQTIEIHQGVTWSDDVEVTVHDFIFTGETVRDFTLGGNWLSAFDFDYIDRFEAVDDYTIKIYYSQQPGLSVSQVGGIGLAPWMPKHFWEDIVAEAANSDDPATALYAADGTGAPSAGPFVFKKWEAGAFAEVTTREDGFFQDVTRTFYANGAFEESNDNYEFCVYGDCSGDAKLEYVEGPHVPNVVYSIYGTQDAAVLALANGEVDFLLNSLGLQRGLREQVVGNPDLGAFQNPSNGWRYLAFNVRKSPNDIQEFRQAVATLIDKEYLTNRVLQGTALPVYGMVPEGNAFWYNADAPKWGFEMDRKARFEAAMELLKSAGFSWDVEPVWNEDDEVITPGSTIKDPEGNELEEIELLTPSAGYDPMRATAGIWIAQWCNEVGIPVKPNPTGFNTILPLVFEPDPATGEIEFDWYILGWSLGNPALPDFHESFFACANDAREGGFNTPGYCDADFDALTQQFLSAQTLDEARGYVWALDNKLAEDVPYVTLFTAPILEFYAKARVGYPFVESLDGLQNLNGVPDQVMTY